MKPLNILIVDDDQDFAKSLANLLCYEGHQLELARTGEEGIRKMQEGHFNMTFMDVQLPGMNGVESFFALKKIEPGAKVVMMTAFSMEHLLQQAIDGGAVAILQKPVEIDALLDCLEA